jgi:molybdopterin-containing oxidoreductase family membrane subunit
VVVLLMGLIIPIFLLLNKGTRKLTGIMVASILVLIGMFAARIEFTIGGEIVAIIQNLQHLQSPLGHYSPTFVEIAVMILAFTVAASLYTLGARKLSLEEVPRHD